MNNFSTPCSTIDLNEAWLLKKEKRQYDYEFAQVVKSWIGKVITGEVSQVNSYGAMINIPCMPLTEKGYLHISQYSENRTIDLRDVLQEGEELSLFIRAFDRHRDCWEVSYRIVRLKSICDKKYPINSIQAATVDSITTNGALLIIDDIRARISPKETKHLALAGLIEQGTHINVQILGFDSLFYGLRVTIGSIVPYEDGAIVEATINHIEIDLLEKKNANKVKWTLFATTDEGALISSKLFSWVNPLSRFKKGDRITAEIIRRSASKQWLFWSKIIGPSSLLNNYKDIPTIGSIVQATVSSVVDNGVFFSIIDGQDHFLHRSQIIPDSCQTLKDYLAPGDIIKICIANPQRSDRAFDIEFINVVSSLDIKIAQKAKRQMLRRKTDALCKHE